MRNTTSPSRLGRARAGFRQWRRTRPFYAAGWTASGGFVHLYLTLAPIHMLLHVGIGGIYGQACGILLLALALLMLFAPSQRHVSGVIAVVLGVASFPLSNLGGLFVGMFGAVLGGCMAFGWMPEKPAKKRKGLLRRATPAVLPLPLPLPLASGEPGVEA